MKRRCYPLAALILRAAALVILGLYTARERSRISDHAPIQNVSQE